MILLFYYSYHLFTATTTYRQLLLRFRRPTQPYFLQGSSAGQNALVESAGCSHNYIKGNMAKIEISPKGYFQSINEFKLMQDIGVGSFGKVKLAQHRGTRRLYAIKIIDLTTDLTAREASVVGREIKIHSKLDHPHIVKLWDTLRDNHKIYLVMDYAQNGSLFSYHSNLLKEGRQPPAGLIYKFFYQTLQAVKYLHSVDIMHRDIKPENLLLDQNLNVKLCDFGWATNQINTPRFTFCGTYEYMAPEMALEHSYNFRIDTWALGILLFELVHGRAPFQADSLKAMKERISIGSYQINSQCSEQLKNLIIDILQFTPEKRLSIPQIQSHQWVLENQSTGIEDSIFQIEKSTIKSKKSAQLNLLRKNKHGHHNFKSMEFFHPHKQILSYQDSTDLIKDNRERAGFQDPAKLQPFKKHRRNITQPIDCNQYQNSNKKMENLFDNLRTQANTPLPFEFELSKRDNKLQKSIKKCKTQGEDDILQLFAKIKSSKRMLQLGEVNQQIKKRSHLKKTEGGPIISGSGFFYYDNFNNSLLKEKNCSELEYKQVGKKKSQIGEKTSKKIQRIEDRLFEISNKLSPPKPKLKLRAS